MATQGKRAQKGSSAQKRRKKRRAEPWRKERLEARDEGGGNVRVGGGGGARKRGALVRVGLVAEKVEQRARPRKDGEQPAQIDEHPAEVRVVVGEP